MEEVDELVVVDGFVELRWKNKLSRKSELNQTHAVKVMVVVVEFVEDLVIH